MSKPMSSRRSVTLSARAEPAIVYTRARIQRMAHAKKAKLRDLETKRERETNTALKAHLCDVLGVGAVEAAEDTQFLLR